jgi:putative spermidine/putrescine transport system permease protein
MRPAPRPPIFYGLVLLFAVFVLFLYGPIVTVVLLAFQGPNGRLVFPMNGVSLHWFGELFRPQSMRRPCSAARPCRQGLPRLFKG